jgi:phosphomannomutase
MVARKAGEERTCPGETYAISLAICRTRQRNQYPKCLLCPHRSAGVMEATADDPKVAGSIFRSGGVLGRASQEINEYVIRKVGLAAAQFLRSESPASSRLMAGCDARRNSRGFTRIFCEGVNSGGLDALNLGVVPPELLAFVLGTEGGAGAALIGGGNYEESVSGVRLWRADGLPLVVGSGLETVAAIARRLRTGRSRLPGEMRSADRLADYVAHIRDFWPEPVPLTVAMDGGSGAAGGVLAAVFEGLPVQVEAARFERDPAAPFLGRRFPCKALCSSMKARIASAGAELGAAFDFPGERIAFFDEAGRRLPDDVAAALVAAELLEREEGGTVVYDLRSTAVLGARVRQCGGTAVPSPVAPPALARLVRERQAVYGADLTGVHYFGAFFGCASPVAALLVLCAHVARQDGPLSELAAAVDRFSRSGEVRLPAPSAEAARAALEAMEGEFRGAEHDMTDGVTVRFSDWWFNLRQPGQAAELRLNVEGRRERDLRRGRQTVERRVAELLAEHGA